ncbi:hypothetical protein ACWPM1_07605 [Tsuneonella sp. HG249]
MTSGPRDPHRHKSKDATQALRTALAWCIGSDPKIERLEIMGLQTQHHGRA